jgi:hypothetical protein
MSGWNASRPTWDPEGGVSDSTPGFPDPEDHGRPGNGRHSYGQPGQQGQPRQPSFPGYDPEDLWPQDQGEGGYGDGANGQHGSNGQHRYGTRASLGLPQEDYPPADWGQPSQEFEQRDHAQPSHTGRHAAGTARSGADQEYAVQDYAARMDPALQDFFAPKPARPGFAPPGRQPASAPQPSRPPQAPGPSLAPGPSRAPGPAYPGQPGYPGQGPQTGGQQPAKQRDGQPRRPTGPQQASQAPQAPWSSQPSQSRSAPPWANEPGQAGRADPWDTPAPRPGSRSASRADRDRDTRGSQHSSRGSQRDSRGKVLIAVGLVVVLAIAAGAYLVLRKHGATPTTGTPPATAPPRTTPSASHPASGQATQPATGTAYTLSTPATAGGYPKLATAPSSVTSTATATAQSVREQAVNSGGKVTGQVSGYYQLSSGQVMSFAGYEGTFNPAKVLASLGQVGQGGQTYSAGTHGGDLACIPSAGMPGGTVCVWVTATTLGVTEFFASTGAPENVTNQSKAAQDTVNFRADAEAAKS